MSEKITAKEIVVQALNTTEVRQILEQKGLKLQKESLYTVADDGTVKVDIDGDGITDKFVTGLVTKSGNINTKAGDIKVGDETVSTKTVDDMNGVVAKLKAQIEEKSKAVEATFNESKAKANAEVSYSKQMSTYLYEYANAKKALEEKKKEYSTEMTSKELKAHRKEVEALEKAAKEAEDNLNKFKDKKESFIKKEIKNAKAKFSKTQEDNEAQLEKAKSKLANYQTAYNDFLDKNGYKTKEVRKNVKAKQMSSKGEAFAAAKAKDAVIEETVRNFVKESPNLQSLGNDYKIEIKGSNVFIKANDGDDRADYVITGLYNEKTGELSTDKANIRLTTPQASTADVKAKVNKFKADVAKFNAMNADINVDKNDKEYKALEASINKTKAELKAMNVTTEELK